MEQLKENASNEEIINKINELIKYIYEWQLSMYEEEIRRIRYRQESDKFFEERILPIVGGIGCYMKNT